MKKFILSVISLFVLFSVIAQPVHADLYVPQGKCPYNYALVWNDDFDKYENITKPSYSKYDQGKSYLYSHLEKSRCIELREYCSKNTCSISFIAKATVGNIRTHFISLLINFIINTVLIAILLFTVKGSISVALKVNSIIRICVITILGYLIDYISLFITSLQVSRLCFVNSAPYCKGIQYKNPLESILFSSPISFVALSITTIIVFLLVGLTFYLIYSKQITTEKRKRIFYSLIFGILSNPLWIFIFRILRYLI